VPLVAFAAFVLGASWVVVRGLQARHELTAAQAQLPALRQDIEHGDSATAAPLLATLRRETAAARTLTSDPVWRAYSHLPFVGGSLRTAAGLAGATDDVATRALPRLTDALTALDPTQLRSNGTTIDLTSLTTAGPYLQQAADDVQAIRAQVEALPDGGPIHQVSAARAALLRQLDSLADSTSTAATAVAVAPTMLGADGPRTYFLAFENNAEARGTGGLLGAYGVAVADHGRITVTRTGPDNELKQYASPVASLGPEYDALYGGFGTARDARQADMSPDFSDAARIWAAMWTAQSHQAVDGVIGLDPVAMADLLGATGPATLSSGGTVTSADVVRLTEQQAYDSFSNSTVRKEYLQQVAKAILGAVVAGGGSPTGLLSALGTAVGSGHLRLWSAHPAEQTKLATLPISGLLGSTPGPYAQLVVNNAAGGKLDYYLGRSLTYTAGACTSSTRDSVITVTLTNHAPASGLSDYVVARADKPTHPYPPGQNRSYVSVYAAVGAQLRSATLDGKPVLMEATTEQGHGRFSHYIELDPGQSATLVLHLAEPSSAGGATVPVQPLVSPQVTQVSVPACR
jgi:hypothetical protein